jgi:hypothetical protein
MCSEVGLEYLIEDSKSKHEMGGELGMCINEGCSI